LYISEWCERSEVGMGGGDGIVEAGGEGMIRGDTT
jgi:hypothetical protein